MRGARAVFLASMAMLAAACGGDPFGPVGFETADDRSATLRALDAAQRRFSSRAPRDYQVDFQRSCFCLERLPVRLSVRAGRIVGVVRRDTGASVPAGQWDSYLSVEQLFRYLNESARGGAWEVRVTFDPELGFPREAFVDEQRLAVDEEQWFQLGNLAPLR